MGRERVDTIRRRRVRVRPPAGQLTIVTLLVAVSSLSGTALAPPDRSSKFDTHAAEFAIAFNGERAAYRDLSTFVLPGATVSIEAVDGPPGDYTLTSTAGTVTANGARAWRWRAPSAAGSYEIKIDGPSTKEDVITLRALVMVPASAVRNGSLNGYAIGQYPAKPLKGNPIYQPPAGFVEVTKDNEDTKVSPHFRLKQFVCKEDTTRRYPKYLVLKERLVLKLEAILERVNALGYHVDTLHVMSGYRTPFYNRAIGDVLYSMHQWGSAADIFIDSRDKGAMDDLNRDGKVDVDDSRLLFDEIEQMLAEPPYVRFQGGMGWYPGTSAHPPFVHVDVRGVKARWRG
jgi:Peptidase M15